MNRHRDTLPHSILIAVLSTAVFLGGCGGNSTFTQNPPSFPGPSACSVPSATIAHTATTTNTAQIVFLDPTRHPQALCNDGTPAVYEFRPGVGAAAKRWVISLQGGSMCNDQASCSARAASDPQFVSSNPYRNPPAAILELNGLQSPDPAVNPDFYDATQVKVLYCSSDYWSGAKTGSGTFNAGNVATWNFQGHAIVAAVMNDLKANHGLSNATEVLFSGESAGGVGVFVNVNAVQGMVPATARFAAISDAGFIDDADNFNASGAPPNYTAPPPPNGGANQSPGITLWSGTGDSVCHQNVTTPSGERNCYHADQLLAPGGTITLPMFVGEAQKDIVQLTNNGIPAADLSSGSFSPAEVGYINYFATQMRSGLSGTNSDVSIFSPDALLHTQANNDVLFNTNYDFANGTTSLRQAVGAWYRTPCTAQRDIAN